MPSYWIEAWRRPGHASFGRIIDDLSATGWGVHDAINGLGDGNMSLPDTYDRLDEILLIDLAVTANSVDSLVRVYSDESTSPFFEWLPDSFAPPDNKDDPTVEVTGPGIKRLLGYARTEAFDWDGSDDFVSRDPDWQYGGNTTISNGGLEESPLGISNPGFEDGTRDPWWPGYEGFAANAVVQTAVVDTGTYALEVDPLLIEGGASTSFRTVGGKTYVVTARVRGVSTVGYQIGCSGPQNIQATSPATVVQHSTSGGYGLGHSFEAQRTFTGSGAFATQTLTFTTAPGQTRTQLNIREGPPFNGGLFYIDPVTVSGYGIGTDPWTVTDVDQVATFQASSAQTRAGSYSLLLTANQGHGAGQRITGIKPGVTYTAEISVGFASVSSRWFLEIRDVRGSLIGQTSATVGTGAWSDLVETFRVPDSLPGASGEIFVAAINAASTARTVYVDELRFYQGSPATTVGAILRDLYADATADHSTVRLVWEDEAAPGTAYLTVDFTDTLDSAGQAWAHPEISIKLWLRMSYLQVMQQFAAGWGYEWRIVPNDVEGGTWLWQVYNPGAMKTDFTAAAGPAIQGGSSDTRRRILRRKPEGTDYMVEGESRITSRARDAGIETALGRIEASQLDRELPDLNAVVDAAAEASLSGPYDGTTFQYTFGEPAEPPMVSYRIGDLITAHDPPDVDIEVRLVDATLSVSPGQAEWTASYSPANLLGS